MLNGNFNMILIKEMNMKKIVKLELCNITPFKNHPFKVRQDDSFKELKDSIKENGLLEPLLVRPDKFGGYELISGHRRKLALELCGIKEADCYIEELSDDEATIKMVDSNIYRNLILPSEKAFAYKMKLEAIKHQGKKNKLLHKVRRSRFRYPQLVKEVMIQGKKLEDILD